MSEELKPCPFCNSEDCRVIGGPGTKGGPQFWAGCDHCNGRAWGDTQAEAIAAWNRRASPTPEGREAIRREALEEAAKVADGYRASAKSLLGGDARYGAETASRGIASAIRALAEEK